MPWAVVDWAAAAVLLVLSVTSSSARQANFGVPGWCTVVAAVAVAAPLAVRRRWPAGVFAVVLAANSFLAVAGVSGNPGVLVALALYPVAVARPPRRSVPLAAVAVLVSVAAEWAGVVAGRDTLSWPARLDVLAGTVALMLAAWALGVARRGQLRYAARTAEQATRRAVADERLRIARELHDVITHSMSLITVKASVANYLAGTTPDQVRDALTVIEDTGRGALGELRRMLGVLRDDGAGVDWHPAPGLAGLAGLAERAAQAGVRVDLDVDAAATLPDGLAQAAYRIVQEALTNVVKHAAPTHCRVRVGCSPQEVCIDVTDTGNPRRAQPVAAAGHGLAGMRERAALFGGEFTAGPAPGGGFRVTARLPTGQPA
jgi:signal transduction histidine kinase